MGALAHTALAAIWLGLDNEPARLHYLNEVSSAQLVYELKLTLLGHVPYNKNYDKYYMYAYLKLRNIKP